MLAFLTPLAFFQATVGVLATSPPPPPPACETTKHHGFDFWLGEWEVLSANDDSAVGASRIEKVSGGCAVRETWMPQRGAGGSSLSMVNHASGRWEQVWIGSDGKRVDFRGGLVDSAAGTRMVLTGYWDDIGGPGKDALVRMTYSRRGDGSVHQHGEASTDHGLSWQTSFDFIYRPKDKRSP